MVLLGALSNPDVKSTYGIESRRLDGAQAIATERAGRAAVSDWLQQGSTHSAIWAVEHAIAVLTEIEQGGRSETPPS